MNTIYDGSYTLGSTSALTFEAGPGIQISEPTAGTVRIGNEFNRLVQNETITAGYLVQNGNTYPILQQTFTAAFNATTSYNTSNVIVNGANKPWSGDSVVKWLDAGNSYLHYDNAVRLPLSYQLDANRQGAVLMLKNGGISLRAKDAATVPMTGFFTVKWIGDAIQGGNA